MAKHAHLPKDAEVLTDVLLRSVLDEMFEGFQIISPEFRYLYVNKTVAAQGKRTKEELIGKTMMECYPGIDQTPMFTKLKRCMDAKEEVRMENEFYYPDGSMGWFQLLLQPLAAGALILSIDITEQKRAREELVKKIERIDELTNLSIDREIRMADLKHEIANLKQLTKRAAARA